MNNDRKLVLEVNSRAGIEHEIALRVTDNADMVLETKDVTFLLCDQAIININKTKYLTVFVDQTKTSQFLYPIPNSETMIPIVTEYLNKWNKKELDSIKQKRFDAFTNNIDFTLKFVRKHVDIKKFEVNYDIYPVEQSDNEQPIIHFDITMNEDYDKTLNHKRYFDLKDRWLTEYTEVFPDELFFLNNINVTFKEREAA